MAKKLNQFFIYKFQSARLKHSDYKVNIDITQSRTNNELITVGDNNVFRVIRKIRNKYFDSQQLLDLQKQKKQIKKLPRSKENVKNLLKIEHEIDDILFCDDLISVAVDDTRHYRTIIKNGLFVNGKKFVRLLAGAGNIRRNTVIFINQEIYNQVNEILNNGRDRNYPLVDAKFSAYYALAFSSGYSISTPNKILVVNDCEVEREFDVDWIDENNGDQVVEKKEKILMNLFDGQGLISPRLAFKWAEELELDYTPSSFIIRAPFLKGMVCTFSFDRFAEEIANEFYVKDIWGNRVDIRDVDIIISASQFKLHGAYESIDVYMENCRNNDLGWSISRYAPRVDKTHGTLNYQFIQTLNLNDGQIKGLCEKTVNFFKYAILEKYEYASLYLLGSYIDNDIDNKWFDNIQDVVTKALIINPYLLYDSYIQQHILKSLNKQIRQSYLGKLIQTGNYQMMISDPFAQCQSIFNLPITGLLESKEYYSWFWNDRNIQKVVACRAPLTVGSEVNVLNLKNDEELSSWYYFIRSGIVYNCFGNDMLIHGGSDLDGDICFTCDSQEMIDGTIGGNPVSYEKKEAIKKVIDEDDLWESDVRGMNSRVGFITNVSSTFFSMLFLFQKNSLEHNELIRRLKVSRVLQGKEIDSGKGILKKPMPKEWTRWQKIKSEMSEEEKNKANFENKLIAEKRPMFFRWLYSGYNKKYKKFLNTFNSICFCRLGISLEDLLSKPEYDLNDEELKIKQGYNKFNPLLDTNSVMNAVCHYMESQVKELKLNMKNVQFNPEILMNKDIPIDPNKLGQMKKLWGEWKVVKRNHGREEDGEESEGIQHIAKEFHLRMEKISSNGNELVNLCVQLLYKDNPKSPKDFLWSILGDELLEIIKQNSKRPYSVPVKDENGSIDYMGQKYEMREIWQ